MSPHPGWVEGSCLLKCFWLSEAQQRPNHLELLGCIKSPVGALPMPMCPSQRVVMANFVWSPGK